MKNKYFADALLNWYEEHQRDLPWRHTQEPYNIWLSEIILQQTRVQQGLPYYQHFIEAFPTVEALAAAPEEQVLRLWQGLGYYSRARNLHTTAKAVAEAGQFPQSYKELLKLKGVGPYTAAAIASFAYNEAVAVVDGNVYRVLARQFGLKDDIASPAGQKKFAQLAQELISADAPATYNQAIMEFGATHCTPRNPQCLFCPLKSTCYALKYGEQHQLPVKLKKQKVRDRYFHYLVITQQQQVLMQQRTGRGIWQNLWQFPLYEADSPQGAAAVAAHFQLSNLTDGGEPLVHLLSHQRLHIRFFTAEFGAEQAADFAAQQQAQWVTQQQAQELAKPKPIVEIIDELLD